MYLPTASANTCGGYDGSIENNVIWTYVSYLRRKLESIGSSCKIIASRGRGYALELNEEGAE